MIPPSNLMIIYCLVAKRVYSTNVSGQVFFVGLVVTLLMAGIAITICVYKGYGEVSGEPFRLRPVLCAIWQGRLGDRRAGASFWVASTAASSRQRRAAAVAVFYALFVGTVIYRKLTLAGLLESLRFTAMNYRDLDYHRSRLCLWSDPRLL